ncbi:glycosyltransferase family 2 protein [Anabaena cylindrica FACHB-243]|uniref:Glycosyl transferase family 2 n=1 Tax=Anabaena cylindrica (strain ATCC 27899 / PCC 7122) TaxID=272123 RepID=K9ZIP7_ANACC|nr:MULTISPECIES: glycosyltransferase family A protein [Anabaena]AFZ58639.1 glycosyl transferase family 2 [Anabaena cylindrica PCC 7122]MBD2419984.1 glycosyltransferase family 2 protein [Anabaena cylindrica FACHB-243]MBY5282892.1 glycosyltransferase family 2 protein [Anabaena sp. CCAP 1446/1C]MBY5310398.1 glycosyltransferase family 2 protein [Anabaena sp. CCAP 1446/1C]MCM2407122.1 glycosyltransferase family 2 protein [Anabaena sp. CCAP 1446/1C]
MTNINPMVTVIIPAYNAAQFLPAAITSVQQQTYSDWELLIINDGSTDDTVAVVRQYQETNHCIHLIHQRNQGVSTARNLGIEKSRGKIIAFLDADDQWLPDKLQQHLQHFQSHPRLGVSFSQVEILTPAGEPTGQVSSSRLTDLKPEHLLSENPTTTTSNWVVRKEVFAQVGGFSPDMSYSEDLEWLLRVICTGVWEIAGINQVLTRYRTSSAGLSSNLYRMETGWNQLVEKAKIYAPQLVENYFALAQALHLRYLARRAFRLKLPAAVGVDFMSRALVSDWRLLFHQPRRSLFTLMAVFGGLVMEKIFFTQRRRVTERKS